MTAPTGSAASVITRDVGRAMRTAQAFEAGNVWVNTWGAVSSMAPYGGYKGSGYGREMGFAVMREVTQEKSLWVKFRYRLATPRPYLRCNGARGGAVFLAAWRFFVGGPRGRQETKNW